MTFETMSSDQRKQMALNWIRLETWIRSVSRSATPLGEEPLSPEYIFEMLNHYHWGYAHPEVKRDDVVKFIDDLLTTVKGQHDLIIHERHSRSGKDLPRVINKNGCPYCGNEMALGESLDAWMSTHGTGLCMLPRKEK